MGGVAMFFTRMLAQAFPGGSRASTAHQPPASGSVERTVGTGASNETFVTIGGITHLFVDEGDCVAEFIPAFDDAPGDTMFGTKILPALAPHWALLHQHPVPLKDAITIAIRRESVPPSPGSGTTSNTAVSDSRSPHASAAPQLATDNEGELRGSEPARESRRPRNQRAVGDDPGHSATVKGRITGWGEEEFPNRRPGKPPTYTSFALRLETRGGDRVLQGEGLKEAINECGCRVGDVVAVKRLRKIKVPAFRQEDGSPILKNGQQVLWDKWLWSITK
ncbi:hypothetical protein QZM52_24995 [Burkholderia metallica]|uniref:Uncharacterized protein n=1 Tax=Burkholderia metallica TaxID=488729 RepID=A0ABT8PHQ7_9BURK|nr:hypothetical protein [Burkholderia metallica]MDN7934549.1 hypothetical protein [Burkholderia metallica]